MAGTTAGYAALCVLTVTAWYRADDSTLAGLIFVAGPLFALILGLPAFAGGSVALSAHRRGAHTRAARALWAEAVYVAVAGTVVLWLVASAGPRPEHVLPVVGAVCAVVPLAVLTVSTARRRRPGSN